MANDERSSDRMMGATREIKVGLFVFIGLVLLAVVVFSISDFYSVQPKYTYFLRVQFEFANGIEQGAPVRLAGVKAGEVREVRVVRDEATQETHAELYVRLLKGMAVEQDALAYVNTLGFIGEKYLEIIPGTPGSSLLTNEDILVGKNSIPSEKLVESAYEALQEMEKTVKAVNRVFGDEKTQTMLKGTFSNSNEATAELAEFLKQANEVMNKVRTGEGTIGRLLIQDDLYRDLKDITTDLKANPWKLFHKTKEVKKK